MDIRVFQGPADENAAVIREIRDYHDQGIPYRPDGGAAGHRKAVRLLVGGDGV